MLLSVRDYLKSQTSANLLEIARYLQQPVDLVRELLAHWERKGRVCQLARPAACGGRCQACPPEQAVIYQWVQ